jgi:hypothetical protein
MSQPLNTFAVILLAFPFYLAQKGRLAAYVNLAKPSAKSTASTPAPTTSPPAGNSTTSVSSSADKVASAYSTFSEAAALFT